ncbi:class I SAM-dependent methyltransferase family protein [Halonotius terrestris]|uniref:Class I SAM-dependent methyltransferase family protein n=1 Tax=Halonotius terrestris TaxID=2487750 RepID=A0A8J8TCA0_9EURY|nr:class I SAM-dependent methyltransferase family protein [Halonotius terrestris]TQQ80978.1 class I SAM-dependent methyltransferase family protein [Halonotius terrestris]
MDVPCVAVARQHGEAARSALAEADALDDDHEIAVEDGTIYIPVSDPDAATDAVAALDGDSELTTRDLPTRRGVRTPADILGFEPSLERIGDIVVIDEDDPDRAAAIADAVIESDLPVRSVLNRASKIKGECRVRDWEVVAVDEEAAADSDLTPTETVHREYGHEFLLDLAAVYFSPRLATERHRVVEQISADEQVLDMFAGVGPFAIPAASRGAELVAVDLNETAVEYCRENARRNNVDDAVTAIAGDVRDVGDDYHGWADRLVMNLPHSANEFLATAVALAGEECVIHYYDIQHEDDSFGPGIDAIRDAAEPAYDVRVETEHVVRSYAPHELNVCLDVRLTKPDDESG